jgi:uncharacterized protein (TIGR02271 family)
MADRRQNQAYDRDDLARSRATGTLGRLDDLDDFEIADGEPDIRGWDVRTAPDRKVGEVKGLIVDTAAMQVRYVEVKVNKDVLGTDDDQYVLVPIGAARLDDDDDNVFIDRLPTTGLERAPRFHGNITAENERRLEDYYATGLGTGNRREELFDQNRFFGGRRRGRENQQVIVRSEEELAIGRRRAKAGEIVVNTGVETKHVKQDVPLTHEEVTVERHAARPGTSSQPEVREDEVRIPVMAEEAVVEKRTVPKEEIVIRKEAKRDTKTVEADLEREKVDIDREGDVRESRR